MSKRVSDITSPFLRGNLPVLLIFSILITVLMMGISLAGLLFSGNFYGSGEFLETFVPNDITNLFVGGPVLLLSLWLASRGGLLGLLFLPGALFYITYTYLIYVFSLPLSIVSIGYLILIAGSFWLIVLLLRWIDAASITEDLGKVVPVRMSGIVITFSGAIFAIRAISILVGSVLNNEPLGATELGVNITDFLVTPIWVIIGILLLKRKQSGYILGLGILYQAIMLMIGLLVYMKIHARLTGQPILLADFVIISVFSLIFLIPFGYYVRGIYVIQKSLKQED